MRVIQHSLVPAIIPEVEFDSDNKLQILKSTGRAMHNSRVFIALLKQVEEQQVKEMDRLTDRFLWRILSSIGLLPKRRDKKYGFFIK